MIDHETIIELVTSIGENGYFPGEPLILLDMQDGRYKVLEGNRRVSALKLINNPDVAKEISKKLYKAVQNVKNKPSLIPSLIAKDEKEVYKFLGFRHISGIKNWNALEKARYLNKLEKHFIEETPKIRLNELCYELAKSIGSRSDYVKRILTAYKLYEEIENSEFFNIKSLDDTTFHFVNLSDSLNKSNISEFLGIDLNKDDYSTDSLNMVNLEKWTKLLYEKKDGKTKVNGTSTQLKYLNEIILNEHYLQLIETKPLVDVYNFAMSITDDQDKNDYIKELFNNTINNLEEIFEVIQEDGFVLNIDISSSLSRIHDQCNMINKGK